MDYFEGLIKTLLEHDGYWVRQSFKVNLSKEEKRDIGKHSIPRPEIDILAFNPKEDEVMVVEAKSYLDSNGVRADELMEQHQIPQGRYKLFTCENYRNIVFYRLKQDLIELGMANTNTKLRLGLAAGRVYQNRSYDITELFRVQEWYFLSPENIRDKVNALADKGYENDPCIITSKILMRPI